VTIVMHCNLKSPDVTQSFWASVTNAQAYKSHSHSAPVCQVLTQSGNARLIGY